REAFDFNVSGLQTKRDSFVYAPSREQLAERIQEFLRLAENAARECFHDSRDRKWAAASAIPFDDAVISRVGYRPLDQRYLYNHRAYGDFLRPALQAAWGGKNASIYTMPFGVGAGPSIWC